MASTENSDSEDEEPTHTEDHKEWMALCRLNYYYYDEDSRTQEDYVDWAKTVQALDPEFLCECPTWISSKRKQANDDHHSPWHRHLPTIDITTLNTLQRAA